MERLSLHLDQLVINPDINPRHASDAEVGDLDAPEEQAAEEKAA